MTKKFRGMGLIQHGKKLTKCELAKRKAYLKRLAGEPKIVKHKGIIPSIKLTNVKTFTDVHLLKIHKSKKAIFQTDRMCRNCQTPDISTKLLRWKTQSKKAVLVCPRCHWTSEDAVKVKRSKTSKGD